ncbi:MAG TPA: hypothetical protein VN688_03335 [Gemmataceae bacterium]|nr:hypothetical protein [Gemmataceae bacterium]
MKLVKVGTQIINLSLVAFAERPAAGQLEIHFAIPHATIVPGVTLSQGQAWPAASDHFVEHFQGKEADDLWAALDGLVGQ